MKYVIADTHFGHDAILNYTDRPFANVEHMNNCLINNWNKIVNVGDTVYHLGDFFFCKTEKQIDIMRKLNGNIVLVRGDHDSESKTKFVQRLGLVAVVNRLDIGSNIVLSHEPYNHPNCDFNIYGHSHEKGEQNGKRYCVSVEMIDYTPISLGYVLNGVDAPLTEEFIHKLSR